MPFASSVNNIKSILLGFFSGFLASIYFSEYFQWFIARIFFLEEIKIEYKFLIPHNHFQINEIGSLGAVILFLSPQFFLILILEILGFFIKKTMLGFYRYFVIIFNLTVQGILVLMVFYNSLIMIISDDLKNDFVNLAFKLGFTEIGKIVLAFLIILVKVIYLNYTSKKVINYINY